jgi:hypothetical protein
MTSMVRCVKRRRVMEVADLDSRLEVEIQVKDD